MDVKSTPLKRNGIWFYGLSGSGKTFASGVVAGVVKDCFIIDGDDVRRLISVDLGYDMNDRVVQLNRVLGIAQLAQRNRFFPIVSTVTMTADILTRCGDLDIEVVQIVRPIETLIKIRSLYEVGVNVVGKDLKLEELNTPVIHNEGGEAFKTEVARYVEQ
jgi:hypothetical protein